MITSPTYYSVALLLEQAGLGTLGADLFAGEWGEPDSQVLVQEGVGVPSPQPDIYEQPAVQVLVRGPKPGTTGYRDIDVYARAKAISDYLLGLPESVESPDGICYKGFEPSSSLAPLGKDDDERFIYSANFLTWRNGAEGP